MSKHLLSIVIPYFKFTYFEECLESIVNQTNKNFCLYIFDDASPTSPIHLIEKYKDKIDIVYHRFDENLGKKNLVEHWNRCVSLTNENWIWLFGDDDIMDENCVHSFYERMNERSGNSNVFKFSTRVINNQKDILRENTGYNNHVEMIQIIHDKLRGKSDSFVIEYIFSRESYLLNNGFFNIPLGWGADDISWLIFSNNKPVITIQNATVNWRLSEQNISCDSYGMNSIKSNALLIYGKFLKRYIQESQQTNEFKMQFTTDLYSFIKNHILNYSRKISLIYSFKNLILVDLIFQKPPSTVVSFYIQKIKYALGFK